MRNLRLKTQPVLLAGLLISVLFTGAACGLFRPVTVYGEFHDAGLFAQSLKAKPEMAEWNDEKLWEGGTGATIQAKTFGRPVGKAAVLLDGRVIAVADGFGQFSAELPGGDYVLTGTCEGYESQELQLSLKAGEKIYVNFILEPITQETLSE